MLWGGLPAVASHEVCFHAGREDGRARHQCLVGQHWLDWWQVSLTCHDLLALPPKAVYELMYHVHALCVQQIGCL